MSVVEFGPSLDFNIIWTWKQHTGTLRFGALGLPKPKGVEPMFKHYAAVVAPAGAQPSEDEFLIWFYLEAGGLMGDANSIAPEGTTYLQSLAIDYDGSGGDPNLAHNVFVTLDDTSGQNTGGSAFGIIHMNATMQDVLSQGKVLPHS